MKAKVIKDFHDLEKDVDRKAGDVFTCSKSRFAAINSTKWGTLVADAEDTDE